MQTAETTPGPAVAAAVAGAGRAAVVRALALGRNEVTGAERLIDRALVDVGPVDELDAAEAAVATLAAAWRDPAPRSRRRRMPALAADGEGFDAALAGLDADDRLAVVMAIWLGWDGSRIARVLDVVEPAATERLRRGLEQLGLHGPEDRDGLRDHLEARAAGVEVAPLGWGAARARGMRRQRRLSLLLAGAAATLLALVSFAGGGSGAPTPTVVRPAPARPLTAPVAPMQAVTAPAGPALAWQPAAVPGGAGLAWVVPFQERFVALETAADLSPGVTTRPIGVWSSADGRVWERLDADLSAFGEDDLVTWMAASAESVLVLGGPTDRSDFLATVDEVVVWESVDGTSWHRHELPPFFAEPPEFMRWSLAPTGLAARTGDALVVGFGTRNADFAALIAADVPDPLPRGFHAVLSRGGGVILTGPGGIPIEEFAVPGVDVAALRGQEAVRPMAWTRRAGGAWEPADLDRVPGDSFLRTASVAAGRFWTTGFAGDGLVVFSSQDGITWDASGTAGDEPAGPVAGHRGGVTIATGGLIVLSSGDGARFERVRLPSDRTTANAHGIVGGGLGAVAYGSMGGIGAEVFTPTVFVPGTPDGTTVNIESGQWRIPRPDGSTLTVNSYPPGAIDVDFAAGTFAVLDRDSGEPAFTGGIEGWAVAVDSAYRSSFPPTGKVAIWYSPDGERWRLNGPEHGLEAVGYPISVAVGKGAVVVSTVTADPAVEGRPARIEVWVGTPRE